MVVPGLVRASDGFGAGRVRLALVRRLCGVPRGHDPVLGSTLPLGADGETGRGLRVSGGRDKAGRHDRFDSPSCSW